MSNKPSDFYISPSGLGRFFSCPAAYLYSRQWVPIESTPEQQNGIDAHLIASGQPAPALASPFATAAGEYLRRWMDQYTVLATEKRETVKLTDGIYVVRVIDAMVMDGKTPLILDHKTASWPWWEHGEIVPQAMGFQAAAYLVPPEDPAPFKRWPKEIEFAVYTPRGFKSHRYKLKKDDQANLVTAAEMVRDAARFPKNRGYGCKNCNFFDVCYGTPGWKKKYLKKE